MGRYLIILKLFLRPVLLETSREHFRNPLHRVEEKMRERFL